jgi:ABC-2 type transport system permease protein
MKIRGSRAIFRIWTLFLARNKEFYRDRSAFGWNILFPFLIIIGFSVLFNQDKQSMYKVGVLAPGNAAASENLGCFGALGKTKYLEFIRFSSEKTALKSLGHNRIDLLIEPSGGRYWINSSSPKGYVAERLLLSAGAPERHDVHKESIEGREIPYVEWLFPGILGMNMMFSALFGVGYVVVRYRKNGVLKRLSVAPVKPWEFLTAQVISRMFLLLLTTAIVYAGCALLYGFKTRGSYLLLTFVFALGGFSMISLGLLVACRSASEEFAGAMLNVLTYPMMFLSEVWFSLEGAKPWVVKVSKFFPLTPMIDATRRIMNDGAGLKEVMPQILALTAMSAFFLVLGSVLFQWQKK